MAAYFRQARSLYTRNGAVKLIMQPGDGTRYVMVVVRDGGGFVFSENVHRRSLWMTTCIAVDPVYLSDKLDGINRWSCALYADVLRLLLTEAGPHWYDWANARMTETNNERDCC